MERKVKILGLLLAGGQGSRLKALTKNMAKPAVPYGGKFRIIDFALSNAANSAIPDIAILTQYKPLELNEHLGIGEPWDYNRSPVGLKILSPYAGEEGGRWFTGTANSIYENLDFIDSKDPDYVLILSGDHIYKMNYMKMIDAHVASGADCTISVIEVPWEDAPRFGIVNTREDGSIEAFQEKPQEPKNNLASMGIYVFTWPVLRKYLVEDEEMTESEHDFGKNIVPRMLEDGRKLYSYHYRGYWKDVGTVRSYWESNLDLLNPADPLELFHRDWRIYTNNLNLPPHRVEEGAKVEEALISEGSVIEGHVQKCVIFSNVHVAKDTFVYNSVIQTGAVIGQGSRLENAIVMEGVHIPPGTVLGNEYDVTLISPDGILVE
ncbi:MAG: glucose-1-phosphate adenylyltransferase [Tissierellia bacterium]|nr:glucose-1-phosphate adenylyltransferase [Tissierellia bacterium]